MTQTFLSNTKYFLLPVMVLMTAAPQLAFAQSSDQLSGVYACQSITDKDAQLACFLAETAKLRGTENATGINATGINATGISGVEETKVIPIERPVETPRVIAVEKEAIVQKAPVAESKKFVPLQKEKRAKKRSLDIVKTTTNRTTGYTRFTLENGEIWQQSSSGRLRLGKGDPDRLDIIKASLGSSFGKVNGKSPSFRMKRVR